MSNNGNYNMNDPDITKAKGGKVSIDKMKAALSDKMKQSPVRKASNTTKKVGGIVRKAIGGSMENPYLMDGIGANDASDMNPKMFINPDPSQRSAGNVGGAGGMPEFPVGGAQIQPPPQQGGLPQPQQGQQPQGPQPPMGNMLNQTPQGKLMQNMQAQPMKKGGVVKHTHEIIHSKTGKVVGKFNSLKDAKSKHEAMPDMKNHEIKSANKMAKSIDLMKVEMLIKKGKK